MSVPASVAPSPFQLVIPAIDRWRLVLFGMCAAVGLSIGLSNPNFRWAAERDLPYGADFLQEWVAGDMLLSGAGHQIYNPVAFTRWQHDESRVGFSWPESEFYPAVYPPPYYCLVAPLAGLPYRAAAPLWLAMMLLAYIASVSIIGRVGSASGSRASDKFQFLFWSIALLFPALFMGLVMGQKGTLWWLMAVVSWQFWRNEKPVLAGCAWALLSVKPTLCFLVPIVMLLHGQWRFAVGVCIGVVVLWGTTALLVPWSMWADYWQVIAGATTYQAHGGYCSGWSVSLLSLLQACGCSREMSLVIWGFTALLLVGALVRYPAAPAREKFIEPDYLLRVFASTALLSPHFYFYDLVWLLLPLYGIWTTRPRQALIIMATLWLVMLAVQDYPQGWPLVSAALGAILFYQTADAANCGTSFACCSSARSQ